MAHRFFSPFWVIVTASIALALIVYLFPRMLAKWGPIGALLGSLFVVVTLFLAYVRGYWIARWLTPKTKRSAR